MSKNINETENKTEYASVEDPLNSTKLCQIRQIYFLKFQI